MKNKIQLILLFLLLGIIVNAQSPQSFKYQAVVRNASGVILENQSVEIGISIIQGSIDGTSVYTETHNVTTNTYGLVNLEIGSISTTEFEAIDWSDNPYFIELTIDGNIMGTSQLLSVPYALYSNKAKVAENVFSGNYNDLSNTPDLTDTSLYLKLENDPVFNESVASKITTIDTTLWNNKLDSEVDGDTLNELQTLTVSNDTIFLSKGGFVKIPSSIQNTIISVDFDITNASTAWNRDGSIISNITGGTPPYTYEWTQTMGPIISTQKDIHNLEIGSYELNVTDSNGFGVYRKINVGHNSPYIVVDSIQTPCLNQTNGSIYVSVYGGTAPYKIIWFDADNTYGGKGNPIREVEDLINIGTGTYYIEAKDALGKNVYFKSSIHGNGILLPVYQPSIGSSITNICSGNDGSINITINDNEPNSPFSFEWTQNSNTSVISTEQNLTSVTNDWYKLYITDNTGCKSSSFTFSIENEFNPIIGDTIVKPCTNETNGSINTTIFGSSGILTFEWAQHPSFNTIIGTNEDLTNIGSGEYLLRISNSDGCISPITNYNLEVYDLWIEGNVTNVSSSGASDGSIIISVTEPPWNDVNNLVTYEWANDDTFSTIISTTKDLIDIEAGQYYIRVTNANGCQFTSSYIVETF